MRETQGIWENNKEGIMKELKAEFKLDEEIKRCYFPGMVIEIPC